MIDISNLPKSKVLSALFNASAPRGLGFMYPSAPMVDDDATEIVNALQGDGRDLYFNYLRGRVMKVDITHDTFDPWLFDREYGQGAAARAIDSIR